MRGSRAGIAGLLVAAVLAGCGSSDDQPTGLTAAQAKALTTQLEAARAGAAARDIAGTQAAVDRFRSAVAQLRRTGALSESTARSLRIGASRLLERVQSDGAPPPQPEAPATEATPVPPGQAKKHDKKKDEHRKHKGHGEEGDG